MQKLLVEMYEKGPITRHNQDLYDSIVGFQLIKKKLQNRDLIVDVGMNNDGMKLWDLSEQALKVVTEKDTFEVECPDCDKKYEVEVDFETNIVDAIKILRMFFGDWREDLVDVRDNVVVCKNCSEEYQKDKRICECKKCGKILKW